MQRVIRHASAYFAINLFSQVTVFFVWILAVRILPPSQIGLWALAMFAVDLFTAFNMLGLDSVLVRFHNGIGDGRTILSNTMALFAAASVIFLALFFVSWPLLLLFIPGIDGFLAAHLLLIAGLVVSGALYNVSLSQYSALRQPKSFAAVSIIQTLTYGFLAIGLLFYQSSILALFYAKIISFLAAGAFFLLREASRISPKFISKTQLRAMLGYGFPLMLYVILGVLSSYAGRIFLGRYADLSQLGVYSFFLAIVLQINAIWATFNRAWTPHMFSQMEQDAAAAMKHVRDMVFVSTLMYLIGFFFMMVLFASGAVRLLLPHAYAARLDIAAVLFLGPLFTGIYTVMYPLYYYHRKTQRVLFISAVLNVVNILFSVWLVRWFGQLGAAASFSLLNALSVFAYFFGFSRVMKIPAEIAIFTVWILLLLTAATVVFLYTHSPLPLFGGIMLAAILVWRQGKIHWLEKILDIA